MFKKPKKSDILIYDNTYPRILEEIWYTEAPLAFPKLNEFEPTLGLGLIPGKVVPRSTTDSFNYPQKISHVGWIFAYRDLQKSAGYFVKKK
jgi:hypothetical protein